MIFLSGAVLPVSAPSVLNRLKAISLKLLYVPAFFFLLRLAQCLHFELGVVRREQSLLSGPERYCVGEKNTGAGKLKD